MFGQTPAVSSPPIQRRHTLGLPAGSVRALLTCGILGLSWLIVLRYGSDEKLPLVFIYLQYLGVLAIAHFFAAHGNTIGPHISPRSPLGLPRGSIRFLLVIGYLGLAVFMYLHGYAHFAEPAKGQETLLILALVTGFFFGHILTGGVRVLSRGTLPFWFQDVQAWVALLALLGLGVLAMVHMFINPTLQTQDRIDMPSLEAFLAAAVGFYFGARS
jgi:hypothetical protein